MCTREEYSPVFHFSFFQANELTFISKFGTIFVFIFALSWLWFLSCVLNIYKS